VGIYIARAAGGVAQWSRPQIDSRPPPKLPIYAAFLEVLFLISSVRCVFVGAGGAGHHILRSARTLSGGGMCELTGCSVRAQTLISRILNSRKKDPKAIFFHGRFLEFDDAVLNQNNSGTVSSRKGLGCVRNIDAGPGRDRDPIGRDAGPQPYECRPGGARQIGCQD
jgi:hypothetical protein